MKNRQFTFKIPFIHMYYDEKFLLLKLKQYSKIKMNKIN